jgi:hypothetical protein
MQIDLFGSPHDAGPLACQTAFTITAAATPVKRINGEILPFAQDPALTLETFVAAALQEAGATYCLGLHAKMPSMAEQLPLLRALWPGPLVCRWKLNPVHGAYGYEEADRHYSPYHRLMDVDEPTRAQLARTLLGVTGAGQNAYLTGSKEAEGCAPLTAAALAARLDFPLAAS